MQTNGYVKTIGVCTKAGYIPATTQNNYIKTIDARTKAGYMPAGTQLAMLKLQVPALKQAIDQQADNWLCQNCRCLH